MLSTFLPAVQRWSRIALGEPTAIQSLAWPLIADGRSVLAVAPTGAGKTLAAFLAILDRLYRTPRPGDGIRVVYVSPLKALNNDIHRNLEQPLAGIAAAARELGLEIPDITAAVRTGDTVANDRLRMTRRPPDILITTPESLYLILTSSRAREMLRRTEHVIVDEIHALAGNKRGAHLALSLERLAHLAGRDFQRIGLSATQRPLDEIARFLGGGRPVEIADAGMSKAMELRVESPVEDFTALAGDESPWDAIEPRLVELIQAHRTTLVFVNNRRSAERVTRAINERAGEGLARAHHGSVSREERFEVEAALKSGRLRAVVATGSLEMGIDIGSVDLVICVESPRGVAKGLQRVGRSGHLVGQTSRGLIVPKYRGDLMESAAVAQGMREADVEPTRLVRNPLDVLAQQIVAMAAVDEWRDDDLYALVRRAHPFRELSRAHFDGVLAMLSGKYPSEEFGDLRPRLVWDRQNHLVRARPGSARLALVSGGTIPDRGLYPVLHSERNAKLGELDEEQVNEIRPGDVIVLGTRTWRIDEIGPNQVFVSEAEGGLPTIPFWKGDNVGRTYELGARLARMLGEIGRRLDEPGVIEWLKAEYALDDNAALNLLEYVREQAATAALPADRRIVVETWRDELGDRRVVVHSPFGRMVNQPWMFALVEAICRDGTCGDTSVTDDGIIFRYPEQDRRAPLDLLRRVTRANVEELLLANLSRSRMFAARFRENAQRALLLPRRAPGQRTPLYLMRLRAADLLEVARRYPDFPIVHETIRELVEDWFDLPRLRELLAGIEEGRIDVVVRETDSPSPFAASLALWFLGDYLEEGDRQQPEFRQVMLSLDRALLRELLGTTSLRDLLDPAAISDVEGRLQRTASGWRARDRDEVEDLLVRLGPLSDAELGPRTEGDPHAFVAELEREARIGRDAAGRWVSGDEPTERTTLVKRHLATHGPVVAGELEERMGFPVAAILDQLQRDQVAASGEFTRGRQGIEYVDQRVLDEIHRASLARLRKEIEPRDAATYARFLLGWHGIAQRDRAVRDVLAQLQGVWLPVEVWERDILPARVPHYTTSQLDQACASGEFAWIARRSGDQAKPRVAFFRREDLAALAASPDDVRLSDLAQAVRSGLEERGARFLGDLVKSVRARREEPVHDAGGPAAATTQGAATVSEEQVLEALWELVFAGLVTNDAFDPLRHAPRPGELTAERDPLLVRRPSAAQVPRFARRSPYPWAGGLARTGEAGSSLASLTRRDAARDARHRAIAATRAGGGRWSLLWQEVSLASDAERAERWAKVLLERHGILAYEQFEGEAAPLPWQAVASVLRRMEMRGEARRGHFLADLGGMQFAHPTAVERVRDPGDEGAMRLVAAMDPANPYGAALAAPGEGFARIPNAYLVLEAGRPVLRVESGGRRVTPVNGLAGEHLYGALATLTGLLRVPAPYRGKPVEIDEYGDVAAAQSPAAEPLAKVGFERSGGAMVLWPSRAR